MVGSLRASCGMIAIPLAEPDEPNPRGETLAQSPNGTQVTPWPDPMELHYRHRSARLQARRMGATRAGVASGSDRIPPGLANALWQWAWGRADPRVSEVAIVLVSRWEWCYWKGRKFSLPTVRDYLEASAE